MGLWNNIGKAVGSAFKKGKQFISDNSSTLGNVANAGLFAVNPIAGAGVAVARSKFGKGVLGKLKDAGTGIWNKVKNFDTEKAWEGIKNKTGKAWNATKDFTSKHADTIGNAAAAGLSAIHPALGAGVGLIANHFANDKTGWGRFAKSLAKGTGGSDLSSLLSSQSNSTNQSNGHVATGYSISATGNNTPIRYNGRNRKVSNFLG